MTSFIVLNRGFPAQMGEARRSRRTQHGRHGSKHDAERASIGQIVLGRISEKFVEAKISDSLKKLSEKVGGACRVALRTTETVLFDPFWPP